MPTPNNESGGPLVDDTDASGGISRREFLAGALTVAGGVALLAGCGGGGESESESSSATATQPEGQPRQGGTLKVGLPGGSTSDSISPFYQLLLTDTARALNLFEGLRYGDFSTVPFGGKNVLAEEISSNSDGTEWTIRLIQGAEWHNGKTVSAEDVIFTMQQLTQEGVPAAALLTWLDPSRMQKMDARTVRFTLDQPFSGVPDVLQNNLILMVPEGFDPKNPVGSGPFKYVSFTPGSQSVFAAFENYHGGRPHIDELVLLDLTDDSARVNALLGGQVDAISTVPPGSLAQVQGAENVSVLESPSDGWFPFVMNCESGPFSDVRVRQAMRLIADRTQLVEDVYLGHGVVGNDLYSPHDPLFATFPQRTQDIEQAKSLFKAAGQEGATFVLSAPPLGPGSVEQTIVLAQQASAAGVTIKVEKIDTSTWGAKFGTFPFVTSFWPVLPYQTNVAEADGPKAAYAETHFGDTNPSFAKLADELNRELDEQRRKEIAHEMQDLQFNEGGYLLFGFPNEIDATTKAVHGLSADPSGWNFASFDFRNASLD